MDRQIPFANRLIHKKDQQRTNHILTDKIQRMKFANFSNYASSPHSTHPHPPHPEPKLTPLDPRPRKVKTVLAHDRIRSENKLLYTRLVAQKPTLSTKIFAEERQRNVEFLRRIGRYPYKRHNTTHLEPIEGEDTLERRHTMGDLEEDEPSQVNVVLSEKSSGFIGMDRVGLRVLEEERREHVITLWEKTVQLGKEWYGVRFLRLKNHYQIELTTYPNPAITHQLKLPQVTATSLLSLHDYDYPYICQHLIKFSSQYICLSFEQTHPNMKKHFYRFEKRNNSQEEQEYPHGEPVGAMVAGGNNLHRKTVFAVENQRREGENQRLLGSKRERTTGRDGTNLLQTMSSADIQLQRSNTNY